MSNLLLEDGSGYLAQEDGSSYFTTEDGTTATTIRGTGSLQDPAEALVSSGSVTSGSVSGDAVIPESSETAEASGSVFAGAGGSGAFTDSAETYVSSGVISTQGTGLFADSAESFSGVELRPITGSGALVDRAETLTAAGVSIPNGVVGATGDGAVQDLDETFWGTGYPIIGGYGRLQDPIEDLLALGDGWYEPYTPPPAQPPVISVTSDTVITAKSSWPPQGVSTSTTWKSTITGLKGGSGGGGVALAAPANHPVNPGLDADGNQILNTPGGYDPKICPVGYLCLMMVNYYHDGFAHPLDGWLQIAWNSYFHVDEHVFGGAIYMRTIDQDLHDILVNGGQIFADGSPHVDWSYYFVEPPAGYTADDIKVYGLVDVSKGPAYSNSAFSLPTSGVSLSHYYVHAPADGSGGDNGGGGTGTYFAPQKVAPALQAFSNGWDDIVMAINPYYDTANPANYGTDVVVAGVVMVRSGTPIQLASGWTLGTGHAAGGFIAYEVTRTFPVAAWIASYNRQDPIPVLIGSGGSAQQEPPPTSVWVDLEAYSTPGATTAGLLLHLDVQAYAGAGTLAIPSYGPSTIWDTVVHGLLAADGSTSPITASGGHTFGGYANDFTMSTSGQNDPNTSDTNALDGVNFSGASAVFSVNRVFRTTYA